MAAPASPRHSIFSPETIEGLRAAADEAGHAEEAGAPARRTCELVAAAVAASDAGRTDDARRTLADALAHTTDLRLLFLGYQFHFRLGDYERAEHFARRRLDVAAPDSPDAARAWNNLGLIAHFRGDGESAEAMMRRSIDIDRRNGDDRGLARDLGNLGLIPEARGDLDAAERLFREALAVAERCGFAQVAAGNLANLGDIAKARGQRDDARALWTRAEAMFRAIGAEKHRAECARKIAGQGDRP